MIGAAPSLGAGRPAATNALVSLSFDILALAQNCACARAVRGSEAAEFGRLELDPQANRACGWIHAAGFEAGDAGGREVAHVGADGPAADGAAAGIEEHELDLRHGLTGLGGVGDSPFDFPHGFAVGQAAFHGIGLDGHDPVKLVHGESTPLAAGMCFSDEPGIYIPGRFGVRLEDCIHMTAAGPKWFSVPPASIDQPFA